VQDFRCSFCGGRRTEVARLIAGPGVFICVDCLVAHEALVAAAQAGAEDAAGAGTGHRVEHRPAGPTMPVDLPQRADFAHLGPEACSFCGAAPSDRDVIIHGYVARICDECVGVCRDIVTNT
jgi:ATP-dependent protease Clp ATPase subunit